MTSAPPGHLAARTVPPRASLARPGRSRRWWAAVAGLRWWAAVAALAVIGFGLLWLPYYGDQALYAVIGRDVVAGRVPYTEIWDIKQPGIYLWYGTVAALFGPSPVATRALDVTVVVLTAVLVGRLLRDRVDPAIGRWVPLAGTAAVLLSVRALDLGQVEQLAGLPAVAALVLVVQGPRHGRMVLAGLAIGVVAVLKLWAALVPLAAVLVWMALSGATVSGRVGRIAAGALGVALPVAGTVGWLVATGAWGAALETWFVIPGQALERPGVRPTGRLLASVGRYLVLTAPLLLLAVARLPRIRRTRDPLDVALVAWVATGLVVLVVQLWWSYHWLLLTPAVLALAARQLDDLRREGRLRRRVAAALVVSALPLLLFGLLSPQRPLTLGDGFTAAGRDRIDERLGSAPRARRELAAARVQPGDTLYVLGDPTYQLVAGGSIPVSLNGWSPELLTDAQWAELGVELDRARPRVVFIENVYADVTSVRGNAVIRMLESHYTRSRTSEAGIWYRNVGEGQ